MQVQLLQMPWGLNQADITRHLQGAGFSHDQDLLTDKGEQGLIQVWQGRFLNRPARLTTHSNRTADGRGLEMAQVVVVATSTEDLQAMNHDAVMRITDKYGNYRCDWLWPIRHAGGMRNRDDAVYSWYGDRLEGDVTAVVIDGDRRMLCLTYRSPGMVEAYVPGQVTAEQVIALARPLARALAPVSRTNADASVTAVPSFIGARADQDGWVIEVHSPILVLDGDQMIDIVVRGGLQHLRIMPYRDDLEQGRQRCVAIEPLDEGREDWDLEELEDKG